MMSYPLEKDKGKAFGVFWAIFQFGSLIGSLIALAINIRSGKLSAVSTSTYLVTQFTILNSHLHVLIPRLGIYHHYVLRHGINYLYSTPQRDHTSGWHAREGRGVLVCTQ